MSNRIYVAKTWIILNLCHGQEHEIPVILRYHMTPGSPATREQPEDPAEVDILSAHITSAIDPRGVEAPTWLFSRIEGDSELKRYLLSEACEQDQADRDAADERRAKDLRDERRAA
ncbi:hypothetical protein [Methylobacterium brachythecii]|uniref:Uncharacterized protein n=1 Tax=Methylobacterium brachythecii TaxID=1176177 RepID=A0A7W6AKF9_9HYPH|nr:hypothetical protein [Methylobacterium brachythecii]MBB3905082.1 hypothetical protein [Methylobacterium brachythecii]GLS44410.1 hypothetical protein GCM10007884_23980 [Methylobacterium brachythecii]